MKKTIISALSLALPAMGALAVVPHEDAATAPLKAPASFSNVLFSPFERNLPRQAAVAKTSSENQNSFFEGFEGRDPAAFGNVANRWLPEGWSEFSRKGNAHVGNDDALWDLTWLTLSAESCGSIPSQFAAEAYEGDCYAYIMCDVMWAEKEGENLEQDEWLVTPTITPNTDEWLYFRLQFRPGWCLYNRDKNDFSGENNLMEVYVTEGDGTADSQWTKIWSLKDHIRDNYTDDDLRADMSSFERHYDPIYVRIADYVGKNVKFAFRYFGVNGQGMALDNVSVGIPMPKPSYLLPGGFLRQQSLTPTMDEIVEPAQLLIPFATEASWTNTSEDILNNEWAYDDENGSRVTSVDETLVTPAYKLGQTYTAPELTGIFETRRATYQTRYTRMQAGGQLEGKGKHGYDGPMGVSHFDYLDEQGTLAQNSNQMAFYNGTDDAWELVLGQLPDALDILGMGCLFERPITPYGIEYVDVLAQVIGSNGDGQLADETAFGVVVYRLPENEYIEYSTIIGQGVLTGSQINELPAVESGNYKNLRFNLEVPAYVDGDLLVLVAPLNIVDGDKIVMPYMKSTDNTKTANSVVYMIVHGSEEAGGDYDTFYNLGSFPMSEGHFAGFLMSLGAHYSYMEQVNPVAETIELPCSGGSYDLDLRAMYAPEKWTLSDNGVTKADWISHETTADATEKDLYHTTLKFAPNTEGTARETAVCIAQPGGRVVLNLRQEGDPTSIGNVEAEAQAKVTVEAGRIVIEGAEGVASLYDTTGALVARADIAGSGEIATGNLAAGVYIVRINETAIKVIIK